MNPDIDYNLFDYENNYNYYYNYHHHHKENSYDNYVINISSNTHTIKPTYESTINPDQSWMVQNEPIPDLTFEWTMYPYLSSVQLLNNISVETEPIQNDEKKKHKRPLNVYQSHNRIKSKLVNLPSHRKQSNGRNRFNHKR